MYEIHHILMVFHLERRRIVHHLSCMINFEKKKKYNRICRLNTQWHLLIPPKLHTCITSIFHLKHVCCVEQYCGSVSKVSQLFNACRCEADPILNHHMLWNSTKEKKTWKTSYFAAIHHVYPWQNVRWHLSVFTMLLTKMIESILVSHSARVTQNLRENLWFIPALGRSRYIVRKCVILSIVVLIQWTVIEKQWFFTN